MKFEVLSAYKVMWLFVFFDLPVETKSERRRASEFRNNLLKNGFTMMQYSVYIKHCPSREYMDAHIKKVENLIPDKGHISILAVTDRQFSDIKNFWGRREKEKLKPVLQLELF